MDEETLAHLLTDIRDHRMPPEDAIEQLRQLPFTDLGFARVDHHRELRQGLPEAIYGPGKTTEQCVALVGDMLAIDGGPVILTRASADQLAAVSAVHPPELVSSTTAVWRRHGQRHGRIAVLTAGTSDLPVANECLLVLQAHGFEPRLVTDVGVAGIHRLFASLDALEDIDVAVVVAGMEGALASVVGGLTSAPVVAVPTSTGYGSSFEGVTALLAMLSSCAAGVSVVGIDNGYGAACAVTRLLNTAERISNHRSKEGS